jgi:molybdopterin molybdotransferase
LILAPLLARLTGRVASVALQWQVQPLGAALSTTDDRETFLRARRTGAGVVPLTNQDSGAQKALAAADFLLRCPAGQPALAMGQEVDVLDF